MSDRPPHPWLDVGGAARPHILVALVLGALLLAFGTSPAVLLAESPMDLFVPLAGAWALWHGRTPHVDWHTPLGVLYDGSHALGLLATGDARTLVVTAAAWGLVVGGIAAALVWRRLPALAAVALIGTVVLVAATPLKLDATSPLAWAHFGLYNRVGWALVTPVLLLAVLPGKAPDPARGLLVAVTLAMLALLKVTYFALGGLAVIVALFRGGAWTRWALATGVGAWGLLGVLALAGGPIATGYVADLAHAAASHDEVAAGTGGGVVAGVGKLMADTRLNGRGLLLIALGSGVLLTRRDATAEARLTAWGTLALALAVLAIGMQSHDHRLVPLLGLAMAPAVSLRGTSWHREGGALLIGVALAMAPALVRDAAGLLSHRMFAGQADVTVPLMADDGPMAPVRVVRSTQPSVSSLVASGTLDADRVSAVWAPADWQDFSAILRDGVQAAESLHAEHGLDGAVWSMTFANPFPMALDRPPARGELAWYHAGRTYSDAAPPDLSAILPDADVVLFSRLGEGVAEPDLAALVAPEVRTWTSTTTSWWTIRHRGPSEDDALDSLDREAAP